MPEKKLTELDGEFFTIVGRPNEKDVLYFTCPLCPDGHGIMVSFKPPSLFPSGAVWQKTGETLEDVTISPSINCDVGPDSPCKFHGWVRGGKVVW